MKRTFLFLALILLALVIGALCVDTSVYANMISKKIRTQASHSGTILTIETPSLSWIGFNAQSMRAIPSGVPFALECKEVKTWVPLRSLLTFSPELFLSATFLSGHLTGNAPLQEPPSRFVLDLKNAHLNEHPQILGLGITEGTASLSIQSTTKEQALITLSLEGVNKPGTLTLPQALTHTPFPIQIPPLLKLSLQTRVELRPDKIIIEELRSSSSLAELSLKGMVVDPQHNQKAHLSLSGRITLTKDGATHIGPILTLLSGGRVTSDHKTVDFNAQGPLQNPTWTFTPTSSLR